MSVDFNYERESAGLPVFDTLYKKMPELCAGILAFDVFVANPDRTRDNIWCDRSDDPKNVLIYDHDQSLLGGEHDGLDRIRAIENELGLNYNSGNSCRSGQDHPFLDRVDNARFFDKWLTRIATIPDWYIAAVCNECGRLHSNAQERRELAEFLNHRKRHLEELMKDNLRYFTQLKSWKDDLL